MKSETLERLQQILGKEAEEFERIVKLLEKSNSTDINTIVWYRNDFEKLSLSLLKRLEVALYQIEKLSGNERTSLYIGKDEYAHEKFLNLITDLLKTEMITSMEFEIALKKPEESDLPRLLNSLRNETKDLFTTLIIGYPEKNENPVEKSEVEKLLMAAKKRVA
jgi:hypothetical protein